MGQEQPADFYDKMYVRHEKYYGDFTKHSCFKCGLWPAAVEHLSDKDGVLELGCGSGQFAQYVYTKINPLYYLGVDFSPVAIEMAIEKAPQAMFIMRDVVEYPQELKILDYNTLVALEFLEHIDADLEVLQNIKAKGNKIKSITSVPDFNSPGHVRHFKTEQKIHNRYGSIIENLKVEYFGGRWLMTGVINP